MGRNSQCGNGSSGRPQNSFHFILVACSPHLHADRAVAVSEALLHHLERTASAAVHIQLNTRLASDRLEGSLQLARREEGGTNQGDRTLPSIISQLSHENLQFKLGVSKCSFAVVRPPLHCTASAVPMGVAILSGRGKFVLPLQMRGMGWARNTPRAVSLKAWGRREGWGGRVAPHNLGTALADVNS